jgi:hypothetical protein
MSSASRSRWRISRNLISLIRAARFFQRRPLWALCPLANHRSRRPARGVLSPAPCVAWRRSRSSACRSSDGHADLRQRSSQRFGAAARPDRREVLSFHPAFAATSAWSPRRSGRSPPESIGSVLGKELARGVDLAQYLFSIKFRWGVAMAEVTVRLLAGDDQEKPYFLSQEFSSDVSRLSGVVSHAPPSASPDPGKRGEPFTLGAIVIAAVSGGALTALVNTIGSYLARDKRTGAALWHQAIARACPL